MFSTMKFCVFTLSILVINYNLVKSASVYKSPNNDDQSYWREYGEKQLNRVLKSQKINGVDVAKNAIIFVGDGMSFSTISAGRIFKGQKKGKSGEETEMVFESFPNFGLSKTYNIDKQVPDSAGTATALFTGIKTVMGAICLNPATDESKESDRIRTIMDWAQKAKKRTGIVTNTRVTHATPAATFAYAAKRDYECDTNVPDSMKSYYKDIARQLVEESPGREMNVIFGGGRDFLGVPKFQKTKIKFGGGAEISCNRTDKQNLVEKYLSSFDNKTDVKYITNTGELAGLNYESVNNVLGLFANNHMSYETVRDKSFEGEPSLSEMTKSAIRILNNSKNKNGYLLMVEGGKIDQAHHQNLAKLALEEMVEFENAISEAIKMTSEDTLIIVTADHSHNMVFNGYGMRGNDILGMGNKPESEPYETLVYATGPGFNYHLSNDTKEMFKPIQSFTKEHRSEATYMSLSLIPMSDATHSGDDVGVFATGPGSNLIRGAFEQSYIPYVISYSMCLGPVGHKNPLCEKSRVKSTNRAEYPNCCLSLVVILFGLNFLVKIQLSM